MSATVFADDFESNLFDCHHSDLRLARDWLEVPPLHITYSGIETQQPRKYFSFYLNLLVH